MTALYQIAAEYRAQLAQLSDLDLPPEVVRDTVESMQGEVEAKLRAVIAYSLELDIQAAGAADAAKRMQDRAKALQSRVDALREYALGAMQFTGIGEVSTDEFSAKLAKKPPSVFILEGAELPEEFMRVKTTREPDKAAIKAALLAGRDVVDSYLVGGYRLAIK